MDQTPPWQKRMAGALGELVHFYRDQRGMSAQQLADRCAELGMPSISRTVITKLENGRREAVSTAELQVLAFALGVPAVLLLFPLGYEQAVEVLPGRLVDPWDAIDWFMGNISDPADPQSGAQPYSVNPIHTWAEHDQNAGMIPVAWDDLVAARRSGDEAAVARDAKYLALLIHMALNCRVSLEANGYTPPELHPRVAEVLDRVERGGAEVREVRTEMDLLLGHGRRPRPQDQEGGA
jgi:transcriptional regulator with XRE-family HTH domain